MRSVPEIDSRYPLWEQADFVRHVDEGRFYLPDAEEGKREMMVTSVIDARPVQCLRIPGPTFITFWAAIFTGGIFLFPTFKMWWPMAVSAVLALVTILKWLWDGSGMIPEKERKDVGLGVTLPLYTSGPTSSGWWGMLITMLADITAFMSIVFGFFFYWTLKQEFPPASVPRLSAQWPLTALGLLGSWLLTLAANSWNRRDSAKAFYGSAAGAVVLALLGTASLTAGPWLAHLDPKQHVFTASVWLLVAWTALHTLVGAIMLLYCVARRAAGRMTARYDIDISNVTLYWHFAAIMAVITVALIAGFPQLT